MELKIVNGDYVFSQGGGFARAYGTEAVLCRVLYRLSARRGRYSLLPEMGSDLWKLAQTPESRREETALAAVTEALTDEPVTVSSVTVTGMDDRLKVHVELDCQGEIITAEVTAA